MKEKTVYETTDGRLFKTKEEAEQHELNLKQQELNKQEKADLEKEIREQAQKLILLLNKYKEKNELSYDMEAVLETLESVESGESIEYHISEEYYDSGRW